jgi:hypothetical protein
MGAGLKTVLMIGIPILVVGGGAAIAYAATRKEEGEGTGTGGGTADPNALALSALRTGDPSQINLAARTLMGSGFVAQAGAIERTGQFVTDSVVQLPSDISGMIVASIKTTDENQCARTGAAIKARYPVAGVNLEVVAKVILWLKQGAPGAAPLTAPETSAPAAAPITPTAAATAAVSPPSAAGAATSGGAVDQALLDRIARVMASGNIPEMRALANELDARGMTLQAQSIRLVIARLEALQQTQMATTGTPAVAPIVIAPTAAVAPVTATPQQAVATAQAAPTPVTTTDDAKVKKAASIQLHLMTTTKGKEDIKWIKEWQIAEGLFPANKATGKYGATSAMRLGDVYGYVPANPFYWGDMGLKGKQQFLSWQEDIAKYRRWATDKKASDPARAAEWDERIASLPK